MTSHPLLQQLSQLPDSWALVAVGNDKRPYQPEWQKNPISRADLTAEISAGRAVAIGVIAGPQSGGLLFVDHDGLGASEVLEQIGAPLRDLPKSWAVTSGRDARVQIIYQVPDPFWSTIKTTKLRSSIKGEQLELRWSGCQSVVAGAHPITGAYRWLKGRGPGELPLAEAPSLLLQQMQRHKPDPAPLLRLPDTDSQRARDFLSAVPAADADDYDTWVKVGMALHSVGDDSLLSDWISWSASSGKFEPGICEAKWRTFHAAAGGVSLGTLAHLAGHEKGRPSPAERPAVQPQERSTQKPTAKLLRLDSLELMNLLRQQLGDTLRWNVFSQRIELNQQPIEHIEHFYLKLAEDGIKTTKELAADALHKVALENPFDPVREYLEHVADHVPATDINHLATAYLRPADQPGTLYDAMLKATLIAAVRRVFEPGSKHDSACVLMGPQGCGKSTFWRNLGGLWFSDALRDVSSRDDLMVLHRSWIMEWAELDHITGRKHAGQIKAFLTQQTDTFRAPYARSTEDYPRRSIIVGSTNRDTGFLVDDTGNRRFWVIPVAVPSQIPVDELLLERDAIWSAAVTAYRNKEANHLPRELAERVDIENLTYLVDSPWKAAIEDWLGAPRNAQRHITSELLLTEAIGKPVERQSRADQMQVATLLRDLGFQKKRITLEGRQKWVFCQPLR
jgi:energy-coupling factor transporter ATP-binding protein EcfA2